MRVTTRIDPKISVRAPAPTANVAGQSDTSVCPWVKSNSVRYRLNDQPRGRTTSAVGTNHKPVSPQNVAVAGRSVRLSSFACAQAGGLLTAAASISTSTVIARLIAISPEEPKRLQSSCGWRISPGA